MVYLCFISVVIDSGDRESSHETNQSLQCYQLKLRLNLFKIEDQALQIKTPTIKNSLLVAFSAIYLLGCKTIVLKEQRFIHPQEPQDMVAFEQPEYQYDEHQIVRSDGTMAFGISMTRPENKLNIIFFGGNKFSIAAKGMPVITQLIHFDANIYMFDHRGYGLSTGVPTLKLLLQDAIENYDYVRSITAGDLILHGHSMGSFEAGWVAKARTVDALVLESSITHVDDWVKGYLPRFIRPFIKFEIDEGLRIVDNFAVVNQLKSPLLLMVGSQDKLTPPKLSQLLYQAARPEIKSLQVFDQANHANVRSHPQFNQVYQDFIDVVQ